MYIVYMYVCLSFAKDLANRLIDVASVKILQAKIMFMGKTRENHLKIKNTSPSSLKFPQLLVVDIEEMWYRVAQSWYTCFFRYRIDKVQLFQFQYLLIKYNIPFIFSCLHTHTHTHTQTNKIVKVLQSFKICKPHGCITELFSI